MNLTMVLYCVVCTFLIYRSRVKRKWSERLPGGNGGRVLQEEMEQETSRRKRRKSPPGGMEEESSRRKWSKRPLEVVLLSKVLPLQLMVELHSRGSLYRLLRTPPVSIITQVC